VLAGLLVAGAASAAFSLDGDLMRGIEDTTKSLDSNVSLKNKEAAAAEAQQLVDWFAQVQGYYEAKGDAADAVGFSRKTHALAAELRKALASEDYDAASDTLGLLVRSCKACHEVYKNK